jgi:tetratricopeptide (TPR) repeat protein
MLRINYSSNFVKNTINKMNYISDSSSQNAVIDQANLLDSKAELALNQNNTSEALRLFEEALRIRESRTYYTEEDRYYKLAQSYSNLGKVHYIMHNYTQSLANYQKSLSYYNQLKNIKSRDHNYYTTYNKDNIEIAQCYRHIGVVQREKGNTQEAIDSLRKAKTITEELHQRYTNNKIITEELATILLDLAVAMRNQAGETYPPLINELLLQSERLFLEANIRSNDERVITVRNSITVFQSTNTYNGY